MGSAYFDAHSLWQLSEKPLFTSLTHNLQVDTCIVGAGISGLTVAYQLLQAGQRVAILDRERLGLGETGLTSAHLSNALDEGYVKLEHLHGAEGARLAAESHTQAIRAIEIIQAREGIECEFQRVDGYLFLGATTTPRSELEAELKAVHHAGLVDVNILEQAPHALFATGPCLHYPDQAQFHPLKYLEGLAQAVIRLGGQIFTHSEVVEVRGGNRPFVQTISNLKVEADSIVVATNVPFNNLFAVHTKNPAYRSYVIGIPVDSSKVSPALFWDTAEPYHYLRFAKDPATDADLLLVGGEDHRTGQDADPEVHFARLNAWVKEHLGIDERIVTRWSGQVMEPVDGLAYIGKNPGIEENIYIVTGDSGHGLTHGTIAGTLLRDLILGVENPWRELYNPSRLHFRSLGTYMKDIAQSTVPYGDWLAEGDVATTHEIEAGEGAVLRDGLRKLAVYKDEMGRLHTCSAVCPHLGGLVRWNSAEKTWDCPCHGSRFDRFGQVVNGPAATELPAVGDPFEIEGESVTL